MKTAVLLCLALVLAGCGKREAPPTTPAPPPANPQPAENQAPSPPGVPLPPDYKTRVTLFKGQLLEVLLSGDNWTNLAERDDLVTPFQMKSYRNGQEVQLIGQAPECHVDQVGHRAWDSGPVVLFTPTTNVWVQGKGFLFVESNHTLVISNQVETRVLRSLLKTAGSAGAKTNAPAMAGAPGVAGQVLKIFSDWCIFDYQSNFAQYFGHVHAIDVQLDLKSDKLSIQMTTNSIVQSILAEDNVVLTTTNHGWAAGPRAYYYLTHADQMTEMTGGAVWHNGDEKAVADHFLYDNNRHLLTATNQVRVWWPNAPVKPGAAPKATESGYRELWSDFATLQWPPTNGPVEAMHATGNVVIVNQADRSRAMASQADYTRASNLFVLSGGSPIWWNDQMEVTGRTLTAEASNQVYHARDGSNVKLNVGGARGNQFLYIASRQLDYRTNLALFTGHVRARLLESNVLRETLTSDTLDVVLFSNEVKTAIARGHVQGETAPDKFGRIKTIACDTLTAHRDPIKKVLTDVVAENHVTLQQFGAGAGVTRDTLTAKTVTAYFSTVFTNRLERAVAERDVVIDQIKTNGTIHATGERSVYTVASDECVLTGAPVVRSDKDLLTGADYVIWQTKTNRYEAFGTYTMAPLKSQTNNLAAKP